MDITNDRNLKLHFFFPAFVFRRAYAFKNPMRIEERRRDGGAVLGLYDLRVLGSLW